MKRFEIEALMPLFQFQAQQALYLFFATSCSGLIFPEANKISSRLSLMCEYRHCAL